LGGAEEWKTLLQLGHHFRQTREINLISGANYALTAQGQKQNTLFGQYLRRETGFLDLMKS